MTSLYLLLDSFFVPFLLFALAFVFAGRFINLPVSFGASLALAFLTVVLLPWLIFPASIDLITILAIILIGILVARYVAFASVLGSVALFTIAILVGGFLLQLLLGVNLAFR